MRFKASQAAANSLHKPSISRCTQRTAMSMTGTARPSLDGSAQRVVSPGLS